MAFISNSFEAVRKMKLGKGDFSVECNINLEGAEVCKILSVSGGVCEERAEVSVGELCVNGKIGLDILFEGAEGEINSIFSACPFSYKYESDKISAGARADINLKVMDLKTDGVSAGMIKVSASLEVCPVLTISEEVGFVREGDQNICTREEEITVISLIGEVCTCIHEENDITIKENIKKVLLTENNVSVKDVSPGVNFVSVSGDIHTRILYVNAENKFEACYLTTSYKEEVELEGVTRESFVEGSVNFKKCDAKTETEELDKGVKLTFSLPLEIKARAYAENTVKVSSDMYSLTHDLEITTESFEMANILSPDSFETKIEGSLTLEDSAPRIDKLLCAGGARLTVSNSYVKGNEITVEGIVYTNVIYLNDDEGTINAVEVEIPFVVSDKTTATENSIVTPNVIISDVDVAVKKGREILFDAKLKVSVLASTAAVGAVITGAVEKGEAPVRTHGIEIYFGRANEDVWDIAKNLKIKEDLIVYQNPNAVFPLEVDQNIIIFYQKRAN